MAAVEKLRDNMRTDGYAPRTINTIIRIVSAVFRAAIRRGDAISNPVDRVERAFMAARELWQGEDEGGSNDDTISPDAILSPNEIRVMLNAATPGLYRTLFTTAALTGARSGELFALRWGDIEIPKDRPAYIYVRRTVSWARINGEAIRPRFYPPKTKGRAAQDSDSGGARSSASGLEASMSGDGRRAGFSRCGWPADSALERIALWTLVGAPARGTPPGEHALVAA